MLVHIVVKKLGPVTRKTWTVKSSDTDDPPTFKDLSIFLDSRTRALENFSIGSTTKSASKSSSDPKVTSATASKISQSACPLCKASHYFSACPKFLSASPTQRRDLVKIHKRCFNCLSQSHALKECKSTFSCRTCQKRHHSLLHVESDFKDSTDSSASSALSLSSERPTSQPVTESSVQSLFASTKLSRSPVLLATAWVNVRSSSGRSFAVRALLNQGSEITFISERLA